MKAIDIILLIILFPGLLFLALKYARGLGRSEAGRDKAAIDAGEDVKHSGSMIRNGFILLALSCILMLVITPPLTWCSLIMLVGCFFMLAAEFGVSFMDALNSLRKYNTYYVSPTSDIDWFFIKHELNWANQEDYRRRVIETHGENYRSTPGYSDHIHKAGKKLVLCEVIFFFIGAAMSLVSLAAYIRMA